MRLLYILCQCTWGGLQSLLGLALCLREAGAPRFWYRGALVTRWRARSSLSLGMFVFLSVRTDEETARRLLVHEYGHTVQSLLLGPAYLLVIGLPSLTWALAPALVRRRAEKGIPYSAFFTEGWANRLGEWATGERSISW